MGSQLGVLAYSARSLVQSLVAQSVAVVACDAFGDLDLKRMVRRWLKLRLRPAEAAIEQLVRLGCDRVVWGAPVENHRRLLEELDRRRLNAGSTAAAVRKVRDWHWLGPRLRALGLPVPSWTTKPPDRGRGRWLVKPRRSGGGLRIGFWNGADVARATARRWWQRYIPGEPASLLYRLHEGGCELWWASRQWVAGRRCPTAPFLYCGSVGPLPLDAEERRDAQRIGQCLAAVAGLYGVVGVDVIRYRGRLWPVEINPCWTASAELAEQATGRSLAWIRRMDKPAPKERAFCDCYPDPSSEKLRFGKQIVYAASAGRFRLCAHASADRPLHVHGCRVWFADIPADGTRIKAGAPVLTVLACGQAEEDVQRALQASTAMVWRRCVASSGARIAEPRSDRRARDRRPPDGRSVHSDCRAYSPTGCCAEPHEAWGGVCGGNEHGLYRARRC